MNSPVLDHVERLDTLKRVSAELRREPVARRREALRRLVRTIEQYTPELLAALEADLGKPAVEAYTSEVGFVLRDLRHAVRLLPRWARARRVRVPLLARPASAEYMHEPLGVVLILGPWNYPFQLLFSPLAGALAAGNAVCLKPSEFAPCTAEVVSRLCADAFPDGRVQVITGDQAVSAALCDLPFDHICFTGSTATGRRVAAAAAERLVPVTLELGGKSPCVVAPDAPVQPTVRRIMWGKLMNAGQTCVAPDYLLLPAGRAGEFRRALIEETMRWPSTGNHIVNRAHFDRLVALLRGTDVFCGGKICAQTLMIDPTLVAVSDLAHPLMQDEIFGPILPVLTYDTIEDALEMIEAHPTPLAAYLFTRDKALMRDFRHRVVCGGLCINDTLVHIMPADLPFGGVGASGYGRYRGQAGFETFSNGKAVMRRGTWIDSKLRLPPYRTPLEMLKRVYRFLLR